MREKIGITPCKVLLCVRKASLQFVLLVKCSYLVLAVCFKAQTEEQKLQLIDSACQAGTKSGTQSSTLGKKVIEIMTSWKISFFFFKSLVFINFNAMT